MNAATWPSLGQFWNIVKQWHIHTKMKLGPEAALVGFCFSWSELEKWRHTSHQDLAINPLFKCDECSYMAISRTVLKHRTTMKHANKDEPEAFKNFFLEDSFNLFNMHDKKANYIYQTYKEYFFFEKIHFQCNFWACYLMCQFLSLLVQHLKTKKNIW